MNRRRFLHDALLSTAGLSVIPAFSRAAAGDEDEALCLRKFDLSVDRRLEQEPIGHVMVAIASSFLGTPYVANVLEVPGEERLVVNLRGLDCVSLVENTLTISRCVKLGTTGFDDYKDQLRFIRYRDGVIDRYPSRLHYFSDWIYNNAQKKVVTDITEQIGGVPYTKTIDFMTHHRASYRQLSNVAFAGAMRSVEETLAKRHMFYVPKDHLSRNAHLIQDGDIIAITTNIEGLDISHTALAIRDNGTLKILHAPIVGKSVEQSDASLVEYLAAHPKQTGVMVARPLDPAR